MDIIDIFCDQHMILLRFSRNMIWKRTSFSRKRQREKIQFESGRKKNFNAKVNGSLIASNLLGSKDYRQLKWRRNFHASILFLYAIEKERSFSNHISNALYFYSFVLTQFSFLLFFPSFFSVRSHHLVEKKTHCQ